MKPMTFRLICVIMAMLPSIAYAQQNIINAFDAIIDCKNAEIVESHTLERNPETGVKTGQSDVYRFTLPETQMKLIKNVLKAFRDDSDKSYVLSSGHLMDTDSDIVLAVGDGNRGGVYFAPDYDYMYSCFLAPKDEDPNGHYRYAYGINYKEENGKIVGKLIITYATTMKYRQERETSKSVARLGDPATWQNDYSFNEDINKKSWFYQFMVSVQGLTMAKPKMQMPVATRLYEHVRSIASYNNVSDNYKDTARAILKDLSSNPKYGFDTVTVQLLKSALTCLN